MSIYGAKPLYGYVTRFALLQLHYLTWEVGHIIILNHKVTFCVGSETAKAALDYCFNSKLNVLFSLSDVSCLQILLLILL